MKSPKVLLLLLQAFIPVGFPLFALGFLAMTAITIEHPTPLAIDLMNQMVACHAMATLLVTSQPRSNARWYATVLLVALSSTLVPMLHQQMHSIKPETSRTWLPAFFLFYYACPLFFAHFRVSVKGPLGLCGTALWNIAMFWMAWSVVAIGSDTSAPIKGHFGQALLMLVAAIAAPNSGVIKRIAVVVAGLLFLLPFRMQFVGGACVGLVLLGVTARDAKCVLSTTPSKEQ